MLEREHGEELRALARAGRAFGIVAGTGTGKTFAYLVPAILSGKRVVVSTGTRALQDQIVERVHPGYYAERNLPNPLALTNRASQ